jgi:DNA-binding MarR family transcriptional regulator
MPGRPWRPSATQLAALHALARLNRHGASPAARDVAFQTGQSPDGAAATLRSLVVRGLVAVGGHGVGEPSRGYRLTGAGRELMERHHAR